VKINTKKAEALVVLSVLVIGIILIGGCIGEDKTEIQEEPPAEKQTGTQEQTPKQEQKEPAASEEDTPAEEEPQKKSAPPVPEGFKTYKDTKINWSIYYPSDWDMVFSGQEGINLKKIIITGDNVDDFRLDVKILPPGDVEKNSGLSAREFFDKEWTNWIDKPEGYKMNSVEDININEIPAVKHIYTDLGSPGVIGELPTKEMDIWVKKDAFVAVISFSGPAYSFGKHAPLFEQIAGTFYLPE